MYSLEPARVLDQVELSKGPAGFTHNFGGVVLAPPRGAA